MKNGLFTYWQISTVSNSNFNLFNRYYQQIRGFTKVGLNPQHIRASILERDPQTIITQQDVYNQCSYYRREYLQSRTPAEALADELKSSEEWVVRWTEIHSRLHAYFSRRKTRSSFPCAH
jgi:hypothetical protein